MIAFHAWVTVRNVPREEREVGRRKGIIHDKERHNCDDKLFTHHVQILLKQRKTKRFAQGEEVPARTKPTPGTCSQNATTAMGGYHGEESG